MKKACIIMGSTHKNGNTEALAEYTMSVMEKNDYQCSRIDLRGKHIEPCMGCRGCQKDDKVFGCIQHDGVNEMAEEVLSSDLIILASPIHSWYCTPELKVVLDRFVFGMNKYYGAFDKSSLWNGKELALITTCGYTIDRGADLWEEGMKRYCKHSGLIYKGMLAERHLKNNVDFMDEEKKKHAEEFVAAL